MNILFTCAGRRNYLINYFKEALGNNGQIIAVDTQLTAPALVDAHLAFRVPSIYDPEYIDSLKSIVKDNNVKAIISLNDLELPILSLHKKEFEDMGTKVIISDENVIDMSSDKWKTYNFFSKLKIPTPKTFITIESVLEAIKNNTLQYPLIVKPRWGSASIGVDVAENEKELLLAYELQKLRIEKSILKTVSSGDIDHSIIIQEKLDGEEYGMDILNDFNGDYYGCFVRKKLSMRSGETDKAVSVIDDEFSRFGELIGNHTKHIGNMDCDFFVVKDKIYILELNPRFGGGYPFSHEAGINTPAIYISWLKNNKDVSKFNKFKPGQLFSKCDMLMKIPNNY